MTLQNSGALWFSMAEEAYGNDLSNLCLARRLVLPESDYQAVLVIRINDSYIRSRIDSASLVDAISVDGGGIVYSSRRAWYGEPQPVQIDRSQSYYRYSGKTEVEGTRYLPPCPPSICTRPTARCTSPPWTAVASLPAGP